MAYYAKTTSTADKVLTVVPTIPEYEGPYTITENGEYAIANKKATQNITVNIGGDDPIEEALNTMIPNWTRALAVEYYNMTQRYSSFVIDKIKTAKQSWFSHSDEVTTMSYMFSYCRRLQSVPLFDTSNVTKMDYMFEHCIALQNVPLFDTSNVKTMSCMFIGCSNLITVPLFDTKNVSNMRYMFYNCEDLINVPLFNTSNVTSMDNMFYQCHSLIEVPLFDTSNVTNMSHMFYDCRTLTSIPALDVSKVTDFSNIFDRCEHLQEIHMTGMKVSFSISYFTKFTREVLVEILNNLATVESTQTLTMGSTLLNKLTADDKAIALNKGWTLA